MTRLALLLGFAVLAGASCAGAEPQPAAEPSAEVVAIEAEPASDLPLVRYYEIADT